MTQINDIQKVFFSQLDHFNSFFLVDVCLSIRLLEVTIPPHAIRGQNSKLNCNYDMEGDKLYSIKWYRNGQEFYRFIPSDEPKTTVFNGDGINVDVSGVLFCSRSIYFIKIHFQCLIHAICVSVISAIKMEDPLKYFRLFVFESWN